MKSTNTEKVPGTSGDEQPPNPKVRRWNANFKLDTKKPAPKTVSPSKTSLTGRYQASPETLKGLSPSKPKQTTNTLPGYFTAASGTGTRSGSFSKPGNRTKPKNIQELLSITHQAQIEYKMTVNVMYLQDHMDSHENIYKNRRRMVLADETGYINAYILTDKDVSFNEGDTISVNNFKFTEKSITLHENSDMIRLVHFSLNYMTCNCSITMNVSFFNYLTITIEKRYDINWYNCSTF